MTEVNEVPQQNEDDDEIEFTENEAADVSKDTDEEQSETDYNPDGNEAEE